MGKIADITLKDHTFVLTGELDFSNVMSLYQKSLPALKNGGAYVVDFSAVRDSNSAGIALIVEWLKLGKQIKFKGISRDLMAIVEAAGLRRMIFNHDSAVA